MNAQIKTIDALQTTPTPIQDVAQARASASVLSHDQGAHPASTATQKLLCFLSNGDLLIAHGKRLDPLVQEYVQGLKSKNVRYSIANVDLSELKVHYTRSASGGAGTSSDTQNSERQRRIVEIIRAAQLVNASDMHFYVGRDIGEIRFRVNGLLESIPGYQYEPEEVQLLISTIYSSMLEAGGNASYFQPLTPQDGRIRQEFLDPSVLSGVRCATRPKDRGMIGIFRLLYAHRGVKQLPTLGYLPEQTATWNRLLRRKVGMNILSGPTGSGKSTTLSTIYAMQVEYFKNQLHVLTVEDPVEYEIPGVNHTNVTRTDNKPDWGASIGNMVRLDPDIAGVGEMRDNISAVAAFALATTGHATYSTLHANDSFAIIQRLLDLHVDPGLIYDPAVLTGLINQGLAPTLCPHCKVPWKARPDSYDVDLAERVERTLKDTAGVYVARGCARCRNTGAAGRTVVAEVVETNMALMRMMRTQGAAEARALWVNKQGGITKTAHMLRRIAEGLIDPAHAEAAVGPIDEDHRMIEVQ